MCMMSALVVKIEMQRVQHAKCSTRAASVALINY